jgi:hypothetical protein
MDHDEKVIIVDAVRWSKSAAAVLSEATPYASADDLQAQEKAGAKLFRVTCDKKRVGYYLLRVDRLAAGNEGVVVAAAGKLDGVDLITLLMPTVEKQFIGCQTMRVHTARPGMARKLAVKGFAAGEIVLRKKLCCTN